MTNDDMKVAEKIAMTLVDARVDPNEVSSIVAFMQSQQDGENLFYFLKTVIADGQTVVRSGRTLEYYRNIQNISRTYFNEYRNRPEKIAQILGWAARLMRYYRIESRLEQPPTREVLAVQAVKQQAQEANRHKGRIKEFQPNRNFGFIQPEGGEKDHFFHGSQLPADWQNPQAGQRVSFTIGQGADGRPQAQKLRRE